VEPLARVARAVYAGAELLHVAAQTRQLLRDVTTVCKVGDLLREPALIEFYDLKPIAREQLTDAPLQTRAIVLDHAGGDGLNDGYLRFDVIEPRVHLGGEG